MLRRSLAAQIVPSAVFSSLRQHLSHHHHACQHEQPDSAFHLFSFFLSESKCHCIFLRRRCSCKQRCRHPVLTICRSLFKVASDCFSRLRRALPPNARRPRQQQSTTCVDTECRRVSSCVKSSPLLRDRERALTNCVCGRFLNF